MRTARNILFILCFFGLLAGLCGCASSKLPNGNFKEHSEANEYEYYEDGSMA